MLIRFLLSAKHTQAYMNKSVFLLFLIFLGLD